MPAKSRARFLWVLLLPLAALLTIGAEATPEIQAYRLVITIKAPAEFLYPYLVDENKVARWARDDSTEISFPRGPETRVGKQILIRVKVVTHPWILLEITRLVPNREVVTRFVGGMLAGDFAYQLTPQADGSTVFTQEMRIKPVGSVTTVLWKVLGEKLYHDKMWKYMKNLKVIGEADWQTAQAGR